MLYPYTSQTFSALSFALKKSVPFESLREDVMYLGRGKIEVSPQNDAREDMLFWLKVAAAMVVIISNVLVIAKLIKKGVK